ncbi:hypothetical protein LEP1GSC052_2513 [Leptospira kmetyi serovar Malaysia str. Bejo-Iso9]|nr:hypothetical protein LEP1GSC052_2513 [Leptospira kmetyi serovar Malaysia str. Bejo-Iso9]
MPVARLYRPLQTTIRETKFKVFFGFVGTHTFFLAGPM